MRQKIILTTEQHNRIINHILNETVSSDENLINEDGTVNESALESIKGLLSKLGRYKVNGKFDFSGKLRKAAVAKIQQVIDKKGNEVIKTLDNVIKEKNPTFPNTTNELEFLNTVMYISAIYDSIVASTSKNPNEEGYLPIDVANGIINDLREYVKHFLDVELTGVYSVVDEAEGNIVELSDYELNELDESWGLKDSSIINEDEASDTRAKLQAKRGNSKQKFDSTRMSTLKSNKLPLILTSIGGSLGGLSWLVKTEWFKDWIEGWLGGDRTITTPDIVEDVTGGEADSMGMLHWMGEIIGHPIKNGADVQEFISEYGADNTKHMFDGNGAGSVDTQIQQLQQLVGGENASKSVGELFNPNNDTFGSMKGGQNLFGVSKAASFFAQKIIQAGGTAIIRGAGTALATKFAGLASVLGPIGVGLLATGALVKIMRMKGQKQSRAKTLNDLYQSMLNIDGGIGVVEPDGPTISKEEAQDPKVIADKGKEQDPKDKDKEGSDVSRGTNDDLYNSLRNLFQFIVNNRKSLGIRTANNVGTGAAINSTFSAGEKRYYTTNDGKKTYVTVLKTPDDWKYGKDKVYVKGQNGNAFVIDKSKLSAPFKEKTKAVNPLSDRSRFEENKKLDTTYLFEGKYIKDKRLIQFLQKNLSMDKLKSFEDFINRIELIRNKVKKIKAGDDKAIQNFMKDFERNPIMATDFSKLFSIDPANAQAVNALKAFIDDIFVSVYSGKFKYGNMIDKMANLGGNINKLEEEKGYNINEPNKSFIKDAQDRGRFKNNLIAFMSTAINLFQYLHKQKEEPTKTGGKKTAAINGNAGGKPSAPETQSSAPETQSSAPETQQGDDSDNVTPADIPFSPIRYESFKPELMEELKRIKTLMRG